MTADDRSSIDHVSSHERSEPLPPPPTALDATGRRPRVSVVVPTYQRCASVRRLLAALAAQTLPPDEYEVVVSIDGSTDGTREMVAAYVAPYALRAVASPANRGRAAACNAGVRESRASIVVLLDDDMEPRPALLDAHLVAHAAGARRGVLGAVPIAVDATASPTVRFVGTKFNRHLESLASSGAIGVRAFYSGNFSIARDLLLEVGGYDESFHAYGNEDVDLAARLLGAGVELAYSAEAAAEQHYEKDVAGLARDHVAKGMTAVLCARKHPEMIDRLRIGTFRQGSRKWRMAKAALLVVSGSSGRAPDAAIALLRWAERHRPADLLRYYPLALEYFFWCGVRRALREGGGEPHLAAAIFGRPAPGRAA